MLDSSDSSDFLSEQDHGLTEFAESLDDKLGAAGASSGELAFGIGCGLGIVPCGVIILLLLVFKVINIILAFALFTVAFLALVGISALLASRARANAIGSTYEREVEVEIQAYLEANNMTRQEFDNKVSPLLPQEAPLREYLSPTLDPGMESATDGEGDRLE